MKYSYWLTCTIQHFEIIPHKRADFVVSTNFFHSIPLKVTLAIRSDFPRRFEQAFRSNSRDIFGDLSTQHGDLEWRTLLPPQRQPIRFRVGETVGLARKE